MSCSEISWKALLIGSIAIIVLGLTVQLVFIFLATGQVVLSRHYPDFATLARVLLYIVGFLGFAAAMLSGGYLTAMYAQRRLITHGVIVGGIAAGLSFWQSLSVGGATVISVLFFLFSILFTVGGALYWGRRHA